MRVEVKRCSIVYNPKVLAGNGQTVTPWEAFCFRSAANATEVRLALAVAVLSRSPMLFAWIWWLNQRAVWLGPSLCDVWSQRGRRAVPPDIRQQTDGTASNHVYRCRLRTDKMSIPGKKLLGTSKKIHSRPYCEWHVVHVCVGIHS